MNANESISTINLHWMLANSTIKYSMKPTMSSTNLTVSNSDSTQQMSIRALQMQGSEELPSRGLLMFQDQD